jgi:hypothetical protein
MCSVIGLPPDYLRLEVEFRPFVHSKGLTDSRKNPGSRMICNDLAASRFARFYLEPSAWFRSSPELHFRSNFRFSMPSELYGPCARY